MVLTLEQSLADAEASFSDLEKELMQEKANNRKALIDLEAARAKLLTLGHNSVGEDEQIPLIGRFSFICRIICGSFGKRTDQAKGSKPKVG